MPLLSPSIAATSAFTPAMVAVPARHEPTEYRRMSGADSPSRTIQKLTRYGSGLALPGYGNESSTLLIDVHHAFVFSYCVGGPTSAGPSSSNRPLRVRSK